MTNVIGENWLLKHSQALLHVVSHSYFIILDFHSSQGVPSLLQQGSMFIFQHFLKVVLRVKKISLTITKYLNHA